jgi:hypothetical protein
MDEEGKIYKGKFKKMNKIVTNFFLLFCLLFICEAAKAKYSTWNCKIQNKNIYKCTSTVTNQNRELEVEYIGEVKDNKPEGKGELYIVKDNGKLVGKKDSIRSEGIFKINKDYLIELIEGKNFFPEGMIFFRKNNKLFKVQYPNGNIYEGSFYDNGDLKSGTFYYMNQNEYFGDKFVGDFQNKNLKNGTYYHSNGDKYVGSFNEKSQKLNGIHYFANNTSAKVINGKSEWLNPPVVSSKQNTAAFAVESIKPKKGGFFSTVIGVLSFFVIPILMYKPVVYSLNSTNNSAFKIGIILISLFIFYAALISLHSFIGYSTGACHPQLGRFNDC